MKYGIWYIEQTGKYSGGWTTHSYLLRIGICDTNGQHRNTQGEFDSNDINISYKYMEYVNGYLPGFIFEVKERQ